MITTQVNNVLDLLDNQGPTKSSQLSIGQGSRSNAVGIGANPPPTSRPLPKKRDTAEVRMIRFRLGKAICRRRRELDFSQKELAMRAGYSQVHIGGIEVGEWNVTLRTLTHICSALNLRLSELGVTIERDSSENHGNADTPELSASRACLSRDQLCRQLGEVTFKRRCELGLSQQVLAEHTGVSHRWVWEVEAGKRNVCLDFLGRLSTSLELFLPELLAAIEGNLGELSEASCKSELNKAVQVNLSHKQIHYQFAENIWKRRIELGLSQQELATRADLKGGYITQIESGRQNVSLYTLARLCAALDMSLAALYASAEVDPARAEEMSGNAEVIQKAEDFVSAASLRDGQERLGEAVRKRRVELGFSKRALAARAGCGEGHLGHLERGEGNPKLHGMIQLCAALDMRLSELWAAIEG